MGQVHKGPVHHGRGAIVVIASSASAECHGNAQNVTTSAHEGADPFTELLRQGQGNERLVESVLRIKLAVSRVVEVWCNASGPEQHERIKAQGARLLSELCMTLLEFKNNIRHGRFPSDAQLTVPRPGVIAYRKNGALQVGAGELGPSVPIRTRSGVTQVGSLGFESRDVVRALVRLTGQLSEEHKATDPSALTYHRKAETACRDYAQAVLAAWLAISRGS